MPRDVNEFISEALKEGYGIEDVVDFMSKHKDETYRGWASNWTETAQAPQYKAGSADQQIKFEEEKGRIKSDYENKLKQATTTNLFGMDIPSVLTGPATGLGLAAGGAALGAYGASKLKDRSIKNPQVAEAVGDIAKGIRVEPTFAEEVIKQEAPDKLQQLQQRAEAGRAANVGQAPVQPPAAPTQGVAPVQPSVAPQSAAQAPASAVEAVATGQSPAKAVQMDVAKQLDEASGITQRTRRTAAQIEQDLAAKFAAAPEGMRPAANPKTNKLPGDVIGQGGWHWYQGQMGPEAEKAWLQQFGRTPQSYADVKQAVKEGRLPVPAPVEGKKGGAFPRQEFVPEYIRGSASLAQMGALAANALGAAGLLQAYKQGQKTGDYSDLGLGAIGQVLGNVAPRAATAFSLMAPSETNKGEKEELAKRRKMQPTID